MNMNWKRVNSNSLSNLNVLIINDIEIGFVYKPRDTRYDKNIWRVFRGIGFYAQFLCHSSNKIQAQKTLEKVFIGY